MAILVADHGEVSAGRAFFKEQSALLAGGANGLAYPFITARPRIEAVENIAKMMKRFQLVRKDGVPRS